MTLTLADIEALGLEDFAIDWHCVTGWSARLVRFRGVPFQKILLMFSPKSDWVCLYQVSADGYTAPVTRADLESSFLSSSIPAFLAIYDGDGEILSFEHGGPRLIMPALYGWKSAKYLTALHFLPSWRDGFWESLGCHDRGRWAYEERFNKRAQGVWNVLAWLSDRYRAWGSVRLWVVVMQQSGALVGRFARLFGAFRTQKSQPL